MNNTPRFALHVLACAALGIILWGACAGVGSRILPRRKTLGEDPDHQQTASAQSSWHHAGVAACVGLGALLAVGGVAVLFRVPWWLVVVPFLLLGLAWAIRDLVGIDRRGTTRSALLFGGFGIAALGLVALAEAPVGLRFFVNLCDDLRAYLPMAHRLIETNGLDEPWSSRRVQSLGGFDYIRALPVAVFGHAGIAVADTMIASIFLGGLFVANGLRTSGARVISVLLILAVPFLWVPRVNTTGVLLGTPLLVAVLAVTAELRVAIRDGTGGAAGRWAVAGGLIIAALLSIRPNLGLLGALILTLGALAVGRAPLGPRLRAVATGGVTALAAVAAWSVDMWRTTGTPLYPLFSGNLNRDAMRVPAPRGIGDLTERVVDMITAGPYLWVTLGILLVALAARRLLPDAPLVALAVAATLVVTIAFAANVPSTPPTTFVRYIAPMSSALAIFLVVEVIRAIDSRPRTGANQGLTWVPIAVAATTVIALAAFAHSGWGLSKAVYSPSGARLVDLAATNELKGYPRRDVTTQSLRSDYARAFRDVDPDRTIAAVDRPYLINYSRNDVPHLDAPGYMTPDGTFPFFTGPGPKIARLRRGGYDTLVATDPEFDSCIAPSRLERAVAARGGDRTRYSRLLDWGHDIQKITRGAPDAVQKFGTLLVIDLPRAERELAAGRPE